MSLVSLIRRAAVTCLQYQRQPVVFRPFVTGGPAPLSFSSAVRGRFLVFGHVTHVSDIELQRRSMTTINQCRSRKPNRRRRKSEVKGKLRPQRKAVVIKPMVVKPKKPNSGQRKVVRCRVFKTGEIVLAYVPGVGHSLQEHNVVLLENGKVPDTPGIKFKCVRGKYDLGHPVKKQL